LIPVYQPSLNGREKEYVNKCLDSTWISSKGEFISEFERQFAIEVGAPSATSVCNGTVALHLAMTALGLQPGDEVIVPALTYVASVSTIVQMGAIPVFVDSIESTWQMNPEDILRKVTSRTKAVMAVHLYGAPCDMDSLISICKQYKLYLIEDCAEAIGTKYKGQHVGTFGDIATFSFYGNKTITTGEGGMVISRDPDLIQKAYHFKTQGVSPVREYWHDVVGYNYRMTNICAAIGLAQLEYVADTLEKKRRIAHWYQEKLAHLPLTVHGEESGTCHSYWMCSIAVDDPAHRDPLRKALTIAGVETRPLFHPVHTLPPYKRAESFLVAESLSLRGMNLPSWPGLTEEMIDVVCNAIKAYYSKGIGKPSERVQSISHKRLVTRATSA
jgi:perosamine synthetase